MLKKGFNHFQHKDFILLMGINNQTLIYNLYIEDKIIGNAPLSKIPSSVYWTYIKNIIIMKVLWYKAKKKFFSYLEEIHEKCWYVLWFTNIYQPTFDRKCLFFWTRISCCESWHLFTPGYIISTERHRLTTLKYASFTPTYREVYSIQLCVIKFVCYINVGGFLWVLRFRTQIKLTLRDKIEILFKVVLNAHNSNDEIIIWKLVCIII